MSVLSLLSSQPAQQRRALLLQVMLGAAVAVHDVAMIAACPLAWSVQ